MKPVENITKELQANAIYAKDQEEYLPLPVHKFENGQVVIGYELSNQEIEELVKTKKLYVSMLTFNRPLQPIFMTIDEDILKLNIEMYQQ